MQFRGVNKHAQNEYAWNAVSDDDLRREWQWMADMGVNMVRLAHYPHSHLEYDIADERGMAVWAENGYAGQIWKDPGDEEKTVTPDGERLTREMVRQNWNHPSILFWSAGNETIVDVVSHYAERDSAGRRTPRAWLLTRLPAIAETEELRFCRLQHLRRLVHQRPLYRFRQDRRTMHMVSETGSGDWITHHVPYGTIKFTVDKYEPEEYSEMFTEYRLQTVCRNDGRRITPCSYGGTSASSTT